jgi:hypothetical protein
VLRDYEQLLRQARKRGAGRRTGDTAQEFASRLAPLVPAASTDLSVMTEVFAEARYSRHSIEEPQARLVAGCWERLRPRLRDRKGSVAS